MIGPDPDAPSGDESEQAVFAEPPSEPDPALIELLHEADDGPK